MRWRPRRTDVVEKAATAVLDALSRGIAEHNEIVEAIRRDLREGAKRD